MSSVRTVHVRVQGRVQGVWYRGWTRREAERLGLSGWIRNRCDRSVEAAFSGPEDAVAEMLLLCKQGPPHSNVLNVDIVHEGGGVPRGFEVKPTV